MARWVASLISYSLSNTNIFPSICSIHLPFVSLHFALLVSHFELAKLDRLIEIKREKKLYLLHNPAGKETSELRDPSGYLVFTPSYNLLLFLTVNRCYPFLLLVVYGVY